MYPFQSNIHKMIATQTLDNITDRHEISTLFRSILHEKPFSKKPTQSTLMMNTKKTKSTDRTTTLDVIHRLGQHLDYFVSAPAHTHTNTQVLLPERRVHVNEL